MSNPFPGMNPYVERRAFWSDFHSRIISYISEALQGQIRPKYNARIEERVYVMEPPKTYYPDVTIVRRPQDQPVRTLPSPIATPIDMPLITKMFEEEFRERYIEIVHLSTGDVVTAIEVLSPINKKGKAREQYVQKQQKILRTRTNLLEIDLLREGAHSIAAPHENIQLTSWDYLVCLNRVDNRKESEVWPFRLRDRLPNVAVPLRKPDPDAVLELPKIFERVFNVSGFEDFIDYAEDPPGPLTDVDLKWIHRHLVERGLREDS